MNQDVIIDLDEVDDSNEEWFFDFGERYSKSSTIRSMCDLEAFMIELNNHVQVVRENISTPKSYLMKISDWLCDMLLIFYQQYQALQKTETVGNTHYFELMTQLIANLFSLRIKLMLEYKHTFNGILKQHCILLQITLEENPVQYTNALIQIKGLNKDCQEIFDPLFRSALINDSLYQNNTPVNYCRLILAYRMWKSLYSTTDEMKLITNIAMRKLRVPLNFREHRVCKILCDVLPDKEVTNFLMVSGFNTITVVKEFFKYLKENGTKCSMVTEDDEIIDLTDDNSESPVSVNMSKQTSGLNAFGTTGNATKGTQTISTKDTKTKTISTKDMGTQTNELEADAGLFGSNYLQPQQNTLFGSRNSSNTSAGFGDSPPLFGLSNTQTNTFGAEPFGATTSSASNLFSTATQNSRFDMTSSGFGSFGVQNTGSTFFNQQKSIGTGFNMPSATRTGFGSQSSSSTSVFGAPKPLAPFQTTQQTNISSFNKPSTAGFGLGTTPAAFDPTQPASNNNNKVPIKSNPMGDFQSNVQNDGSTGEFDSMHYPHSQIMMEQFHEKFGLRTFRTNQLQVINAALSGNNCFVLMPTGGGKSLCYQLPAILVPGVTIVISPLKSLFLDQVNKLEALDIPVAQLSDNMTEKQCTRVYVNLGLAKPKYKLIYVTPNKIIASIKLKYIFTSLYKRGKLARFIIDEAHCVSQWGHDFRPDYKKLTILRQQFPNVPIMALTATATPRVRFDISDQLQMSDCKWFLSSFNRPNLKYSVLPKTGETVLKDIVALIKSKFMMNSGIVYCLYRNDCDQVASYMSSEGIKATSYHAGLTDEKKEEVQNLWVDNKIRVVCATIAFCMGIDKTDVRYVIHHSMPKSIEGYYQEAGRAGRDGDLAHCIIYYNNSDILRIRKLVEMDKTSKLEARKIHIDNLFRMVQFCENKRDCRRSQQLNYFGENFNRDICIAQKDSICDNCQQYLQYKMIDVTGDCKAIVREELYVANDIPVTYIKIGNLASQLMDGENSKATTSATNIPESIEQLSELQEQCYQDLFEHCCTMANVRGVTMASIMNVQALRAMASKLPETEAEMLSLPYITKENFEEYGRELLEITIKHAIERTCMVQDEMEICEMDIENNYSDDSRDWNSISSVESLEFMSATKFYEM